MSYDYKSPKDLVKWAKVQMNNPNYYKNGGIGRYDGNYRQFDCCGLFKCFMWHDYPNNDGPACYNKTQKDLNCEGLIAEAKEKGPISTIPEIPGVLVYMRGHMGIYIGNGEVIESTGHAYDGVSAKIYKTYFKGNHRGYKRDTWTHWFKSPNLNYDDFIPEEPITLKYSKGDKVLVNGSLYRDSKGNGKGMELINHVGVITITNNDYNTTKPYHIDDLGWVSEINITPYEEIEIEEPTDEIPNDYNEDYYHDNTKNNPLLVGIQTIIDLLNKLIKLISGLFGKK